MPIEFPPLGCRASVLSPIEDVTRKVLSAVTDSMRDIERYDAIEKRIKEIVKYGEEGRDVEWRVASFYEGLQNRLFTYFVVKDVRIVFAPPESGGNSGSPIMNGRGECIGAAFDGNYESISSDYLFIKETTRSINVDSRYILFILDKMSGAKRLLDEMKIR